MNLQAIREKLLDQTQQYGASGQNSSGYSPSGSSPAGREEVLIDWAPSPSPARAIARPTRTRNTYSAPAQTHQLAQTVENLKQRSAPPGTPPTASHQGTAAIAAHGSRQTQAPITLHHQRLQAIVHQINDLSRQQERAILEMKRVADRLDFEHHRLQHSEGSAPTAAVPPTLTLASESAVVAFAEQDDLGNILLTYRSVDLYQADREAKAVAQTLRDRRPIHPASPTDRPPPPESGLRILLAEPLAALQGIGDVLGRIGSQGLPLTARPTAKDPPSMALPAFSWVDSVLWFGGGVLGRLVLNLALSTYPGLWSLAVTAITALTAYALYRATLAPRGEVGLAYRVLLAVAGLIVGGRF